MIFRIYNQKKGLTFTKSFKQFPALAWDHPAARGNILFRIRDYAGKGTVSQVGRPDSI